MERTCEVSIEQDVNPLGSNRGKSAVDGMTPEQALLRRLESHRLERRLRMKPLREAPRVRE
jgi:hypothetical protein